MKNFFEINNVTFAASKKNKVNNQNGIFSTKRRNYKRKLFNRKY